MVSPQSLTTTFLGETVLTGAVVKKESRMLENVLKCVRDLSTEEVRHEARQMLPGFVEALQQIAGIFLFEYPKAQLNIRKHRRNSGKSASSQQT